MTKLISLSALRPRSGKDTLASALCHEVPGAKTLAFATKLRLTVAEALDRNVCNVEDFVRVSDSKGKDIPLPDFAPRNVTYMPYLDMLLRKGFNRDTPMSARQHLQLFGNDFIKGELGLESFWVDALMVELKALRAQGCPLVIITDTRSPNEFDTLKDLGARMLLIKRVGFPKDVHDETPAHAVEQHSAHFDYDHTIYNQFGFPNAMLPEALKFI